MNFSGQRIIEPGNIHEIPKLALEFSVPFPEDINLSFHQRDGRIAHAVGQTQLRKQLGVTFFSWLAIKSGRAAMPEGVTWSQIWGVSCLAGVGFTMALFIDELAFLDPSMIAEAKIGILLASLISGIAGYLVLRKVLPARVE